MIKRLVARFGDKPLRRNKTAIIIDDKPKAYKCSIELVNRLLSNRCELCGSDQDIQGHHVRKLKEIKQRYRGLKRNHPPKWVEFMIKRNRKVVFVCLKCHIEIHNGKYDGRKVGSRLTGEPYDTERVTYGSEGASWKSDRQLAVNSLGCYPTQRRRAKFKEDDSHCPFLSIGYQEKGIADQWFI